MAPTKNPGCEVCHHAINPSKQTTQQRERRLHRGSPLVGRLPFGQERAIIQRQPRRLLGHIHVKCCAGKNRRGDQRNKSESHGSTLL
jgi:hypothetical protein